MTETCSVDRNERHNRLLAWCDANGVAQADLARWCDEYGGDEDEERHGRFAVFERQSVGGGGETLCHTFDEETDAADYVRHLIAGDEYADWQPVAVIDLDTGDEFMWHVTVTIERVVRA